MWNGAVKNFCLTCHPTGFGGKHPEDKFPISRGKHGPDNVQECKDCHSEPGPSRAGQNTNCTKCHPTNEYDGEHDEKCNDNYTKARDYPQLPFTKKNFCVKCHTRGKSSANCNAP